MKGFSLSLSLLFLIASSSIAQIRFEQQLPYSTDPQLRADFDALQDANSAIADVDNDGDMDVLLMGRVYSASFRITKLYLNDGKGNYLEVQNTPFTGIDQGACEFADIDGDGDQDLLIMGNTGSNPFRITRLYRNNGSGIFTLVNNTPFVGLIEGDISFGDIDGDNDLDLFITGGTFFGGGATSALYTNDGNGNFSTVSNTGIEDFFAAAHTFADIDGDNDLDLIIGGATQSAYRTRVYKNDGNGIFSIFNAGFLVGIHYGDVDVADLDGDGDLDLMTIGSTNNSPVCISYLNNGNGVFTQKSNPFQGMVYSNLSFLDFDSDGDLDVLVIGNYISNTTKLYRNNGSANFTLVNNTPFHNASAGGIEIFDADGDSDDDVVITGEIGSRLYLNQNGVFYEVTGSPFTALSHGTVILADVDNDQNIDLICNGDTHQKGYKKFYYKNNGSGVLTSQSPFNVSAVGSGDTEMADIDGDGDLDILISGRDNTGSYVCKMYKNNGSGGFNRVNSVPFPNFSEGKVRFGDIDGDSDQDLLIIGEDNNGNYLIQFYKNNGSGVFTQMSNAPNDVVRYGDADFADIDGDSDLDLLLIGQDQNFGLVSKLYKNNGLGVFTSTSTSISGARLSAIEFGDVDGDNDLDVMVTGTTPNTNTSSKLYLNNGTGVFTFSNQPFQAVYAGDIEMFDMDNDGDLDVFISGNSGSTNYGEVYENNGSGTFSPKPNAFIGGYIVGEASFGDTDNDGDLDLVTTGISNQGQFSTNLYLNECNTTAIHKVKACSSYTWINGVTYTSNVDTVQFTVAKSSFCDSIVTLDLEIYFPTVDTAHVQACNSFTWPFNNILYRNSGIYVDSVLSSVGCDSTIYLDLQIDTINASVGNKDDSLFALQTGISYQWLDCNNGYSLISGANQIGYAPTVSGSYAVQVNNNGCLDTSICQPVIITNLIDRSENSGISLFPNPVQENLFLELPKGKKSIWIYNSNGALIDQFETNDLRANYSMKNYINGIYLIKIKHAKGVFSQKLLR